MRVRSTRATLRNDVKQARISSTPQSLLEIFVIRASCGGTLQVDENGSVVNTRAPWNEAGDCAVLLAVRVRARPRIGFLVAAPALRTIKFADEDRARTVQAVLLCRHGGPDQVALRHPLVQHHVCSPPSDNAALTSEVMFNRPQVGGWETYTLAAPPSGTALPQAVSSALEDAARLCATDLLQVGEDGVC